LLIALSCLVTSCSKEKNEDYKTTGTLTFSYSSILNQSKKVLGQDLKGDSSTVDIPHTIVVSITDNSGKLVYNMEEIPLYNMNGNYISKPISLEQGSYKLTDFLVLDKNGNVLYLAPKEGSSKAYLVSDPLPIDFNVSKDNVTKVSVEVLKNTGEDPSQYGYTTFTFNVVEVFNFHIGVFIYNESSQNFALTTSNIEIQKDGTTIYDNALYPITTSISLRKDVGVYTVTIKKDGYQDYTNTFTLADLQGYTESDPLVVILSKADVDLKKGLIAYYPFNGNANDESGFNHNGTVYNATLTTDRHGNQNSAYEFDGFNAYINTFSMFDLSVRTASVWVYAYDIHRVNPNNLAIIAMDGPSLVNGNLAGSFDNGILRINAGGSQPSDCLYYPNLSEDKWYNIVLVRTATQTQYYINGNLVQTGTSGTLFTQGSPNSNLIIGAGRSTTSQFFNGKIDDLAIYDRALSTTEIKYIYEH